MVLKLTFLPEPSLQRNDPRQRDLGLATAKSHSAEWTHRSRARTAFTASSDGTKVRPKLVKHKKRRPLQRVQDAEKHQDLAKAKALIPRPPTLSSYLKETYGHDPASVVHISGLYDFLYTSFGPVYCWPILTDDSERLMFKGRVIDAFLNEPAHAEAMLALLQVFRDRADESAGTTATSVTILRHQSNALSLLCAKLDDPQSATQLNTLWTIVTHLVLNEAVNDWTSFETNMHGLHQILDMQGGMKKIQAVDGRLYQFIRLIEHVQDQYQEYAIASALSANPTEISTAKFASLETLPKPGENVCRTGAWRHTSEQLLTAQLPEGILDLYRSGRVRREIAVWLGLGLDWLHQHESSAWNDPVWEAPIRELLQELRALHLTQPERYLCIALLVILCSTDMSDGLHRGQNLNTLEHEIRGHVIRLHADREENPSLFSLPVQFEDYEVWASLTIVGMYLDILTPWPCHNLLGLLVSCMARDEDNRLANWGEVSGITSKFYMTVSLEARWRFHWKIATAEKRAKEE